MIGLLRKIEILWSDSTWIVFSCPIARGEVWLQTSDRSLQALNITSSPIISLEPMKIFGCILADLAFDCWSDVVETLALGKLLSGFQERQHLKRPESFRFWRLIDQSTVFPPGTKYWLLTPLWKKKLAPLISSDNDRRFVPSRLSFLVFLMTNLKPSLHPESLGTSDRLRD